MTGLKTPDRTKRGYLAGFLLIILLGVFSLKVLLPGSEQHTVILISQDMEFRSKNQELRFPPGSRLHLIFRNQDRGIRHQLAIPELDVETPIIRSGEEVSRTFVLPRQDTILQIECPLHPMMSSRILVGNP